MTRTRRPLAFPIVMGAAGVLAVLQVDSFAYADAPAAEAEVRLAPSRAGVFGAWLVAGPFAAARPALGASPLGVDDRSLKAVNGAVLGGERQLGTKRRPPARWTLVSSGPPPSGVAQDPGVVGSRTIDLKAMLEDGSARDVVAYASGRLHLDRASKVLLMLGVDDGVRVSVDGVVVFSRDDARPLRDDDDIVPLDLSAGDHDLLFKLHQRDGAWAFRAKVVDSKLLPPAGTYLTLPGTTATDAELLTRRMSWLVVDRTFDGRSSPPTYRPTLTVRYPEGAPRGVPLSVSAKLSLGAGPAIFDVDAGGVEVTTEGVSDLVVALPSVAPPSASAILESSVAGRVVKSNFFSRPQSERALTRAQRALDRVTGEEPWLMPGSLDSVRYLTGRLGRLVARGDPDAEAEADEARELDLLAERIERAIDPYEGRTGIMRRALVTPFDTAPSEFGIYVPPSFKPGESRRYPLVVGLHGMNSYPMSMMGALFGLDDEKKEPSWKDRHPAPVPAVDAFVITPYAHGNTMYREIGEDDVLYMMEWAKTVFPIDETRITVTGPSMGGIGAASLPFHFPHVFAAAAPLCGYHSYVIRADIASRPKRPWEARLLEERSNVYWAENGEHLPLWIVHGTRDLPEANSYVLIDRYEKLKYPIKHDHPDAGHNVWGTTYGDLKGLRWLLSQRLDRHPRHVRFRTLRARYGTSAWVTIDELANESSWADVDALAKTRSSVVLTTSGVSAIALARDDNVLDPHGPIAVTIDGNVLAFEQDEALTMHRAENRRWQKGAVLRPKPVKRGHVTGPIRDVFHEPLLFVYADDDEAATNERVARGFARRPGIETDYPVMSDAEFLAKNEPLANDRALFLVGRANKVLAAIDREARTRTQGTSPFPIRIETGTVIVGNQHFSGREIGAAFIHPNPVRPDRYVVIVAGADVAGTLRALSMPDLIPDFAVWDESLGPARGQILLGAASLRAGGFFQQDWSLPASIDDPLAMTTRPTPQTERDAVPGLP